MQYNFVLFSVPQHDTSDINFLELFLFTYTLSWILFHFRLNFLSINRFERKKNLQLAISAFALLQSFGGVDISDATLTIAGQYFFPLSFFFQSRTLFPDLIYKSFYHFSKCKLSCHYNKTLQVS